MLNCPWNGIGGMYGFVRLTYGNHLGFLVGISEILQNLIYTTYLVIWMSNLVSKVIFNTEVYSIAFSALFFLIAIPLHVLGGKIYWRVSTSICAIAIGFLLLYVITASMSASESHMHHNDVMGGKRWEDSFASFPFTTWFFVGIEMIPLVTFDAQEVSVFYVVSE